MTGNLQAIGFLLTWVLGWAIGGSLLDAGLANSGLASAEGSGGISALSFLLWSLLWGGGGLWLYQRWTQPPRPKL